MDFAGGGQWNLGIPTGPEVESNSLVTGDISRFHPAGKKVFGPWRHDSRGTSEIRTRIVFSVKGQAKRLFPESFSFVSISVWTPSASERKNQAKEVLLRPDSKLGSQRTESRGWISGAKFIVDVP